MKIYDPNIYRGVHTVMNFLFPLPPLPEQRRIAKKQQELFDKITLI